MIVSQPASEPALSPHYRAIFALANGLVGVEGSIDECAFAPDCFIPDAFLSRPIDYHEAFPGYARATDTRLACPSPVLLQVLIGGERVDFAQAEMLSFSRKLDLATGIVSRNTKWRLADGRMFSIEAERLVPRDGPASVVSRISFAAENFSGDVALVPDYGFQSEAAGDAADDPRIAGRAVGNWTLTVRVGDGASETTHFRNGGVELAYLQSISAVSGLLAETDGRASVSADILPGEKLVFDRVVEIACGHDVLPDHPFGAPVSPSFDAYVAAQRRSLDTFWANVLCTIEGDDGLTGALRYNLFQLDQSSSRSDSHSIAAKGLTGEGYEGHYFWDAEAFMLPALALLQPDRARHLVAYRARMLDRARDGARAMGHRSGALYPWRTIGGSECSSHYPTGAAQYHINGDIAFAIQFYVEATGDEAFLWDTGAEVLFETARIWPQIGQFDDRRDGAFCIYSVTGPDEYSALVDNDFYTNAIARRHLGFAVATAERMKSEHPRAFASLSAAIGLSETELAVWQRAADRMWLAVDPKTGVSAQDDLFLGKPPLPASIARTKGRPLLLDHHPLTLFRHRICKQGNVVQAIAMDLVPMPLSLKERNSGFYEPITTHDSTLSPVAFAIVAAEIGDAEAARAFHRECAFADLENLHQNTSHGLHLAALAGSWLALTQGWGGLRTRNGRPHFRPVIHPDWKAYTFRFAWQGSLIQVRVDQQGAHYRLLSGAPVRAHDHGRLMIIGTDGCIMPRPSVGGVIFDLDGVLTDTAEDHYQAWQALADRHGFRFDRHFNERLKGVDRRSSLHLILDRSDATPSDGAIEEMLDEKNRIYRSRLESYSPANLFPGVEALFEGCRAAGLRIGLASASRNAADVVARLGIADAFDFIADPAVVANQKPAPDIFLACAQGLGVAPSACVGVEDAEAGIAAIHSAGMSAIGVGTPEALPHAGFCVPQIAALTVDAILSRGGNSENSPLQRGVSIAGEEVS